ncbi:hypothetical protein BDP27DRAFT_1427863 [Rhodocollybia butyracea]|uniref:CxC2-like cysteine cluster KDZ transposase-associated domain-containing protein n=1 Tax=Rhodocollybia butyracea TaxID=206335 RepID=A0A9P5PFK8_9AGAR|nr:hypothetical protein BDP27DRAFT_1427863 [Rhodocollybia butyracea]
MSKHIPDFTSTGLSKRVKVKKGDNPLARMTLTDFGISNANAPVITTKSLASGSSHHAKEKMFSTAPISPIKACPLVTTYENIQGDWEDLSGQEKVETQNTEGPKRKCSQKSDYLLLSWMKKHDEVLRAMMTTNLRSSDASVSRDFPVGSLAGVPEYTCLDCFSRKIKWNGLFFEDSSLQELSLCIQFGHCDGSVCPCPVAGPSDFTILHNNKLHSVNIDFCHCPKSVTKDHWEQLMLNEWLPATHEWPKTASTFCSLENFHVFSTWQDYCI